MHDASSLYTCIIHAKMVQHVYTQMLEFTVFKDNLLTCKNNKLWSNTVLNYSRTI